eukprot:TRINITY_DN113150_c0_g1_i1.p1 TRINITY_DN113150_c0_g1~~TRINITY_DN113150_c0_g1_i1.p1  ORF type:complete len:316 (-),score=11.77 TRINITY_DN113150_c0_g1_i1:197-1117(-)
MPVELTKCTKSGIPDAHSFKPSSLLALNQTLYLVLSCTNQDPHNTSFAWQRNLNGWILTSHDWGTTWNSPTPLEMFTGCFAAPTFIQFGRNQEWNPDQNHVYAMFACSDNGSTYWAQNDKIFLGRVPVHKVLQRSSWQFFSGLKSRSNSRADGEPTWSSQTADTVPVFRYPHMIGENSFVWLPHPINRVVFANYGFLGSNGQPRPWHQRPYQPGPGDTHRTQLVVFSSPTLWGPHWDVVHRDDNWAPASPRSTPCLGAYTPSFPSKWVRYTSQKNGTTVTSLQMVFSAIPGSYHLTCLQWQLLVQC